MIIKQTARWSLLLCILWCCTYCIDEIQLEVEESPATLTIDGFLSTDPGPYVIRVRQTAQFSAGPEGVQDKVRGANVLVNDDLGNSIVFTEQDNGDYVSPTDFQAEIGRTYTLEVRVNGNTYRSTPEPLKAPIQIDRTYIDVRAVQTINSAGNDASFTQVGLRVDTPLPQTEEGTFLKWRISGEYEYKEITAQNNLNPISCYVWENIDFDNVAVASSRQTDEDFLQSQEIIERSADYRYTTRYCFHVYQHTISENAYNFWKDVGSEINRTGSIFETPPSRIIGNISNVANPDEIVLGLFSAFSADTMRYFVYPEEVSNPVPLCRPFPRPPDDCFNCLLREGSTDVKPDYWE